MKTVSLGKTGLNVSKMCFGTLTVGPLQANLPIPEGGAVIASAIRQGICFFDTAELYQTYPYLLEGMKQSGKQDIVISSKTYAYTRELAEKAVEEARQALDRDYIDIFMLHEQESIFTLKGHMEALSYLYDCKAKGIIKAVGASMHHIAAVYGAAELGLDVIHPMLNLTGLGIVDGSRTEMETAIQKAHENGIGVFSMKALGGGNLLQKAKDCLDYITALPYIDSVALGCKNTEEVTANVKYFETGEMLKIKLTDKKLHIEDYCDGCGQCVKRCGQHALELKNGQAHCDSDRCVLCGYCSGVCHLFAIKVV
ncbi:MAG: aldo/keto reductase [Clostridiales bacterium 43-6]|nr:MAG: aldo/keto reductase [Clostridiales bacterium 43-6]